jgi:hypothetical protein
MAKIVYLYTRINGKEVKKSDTKAFSVKPEKRQMSSFIAGIFNDSNISSDFKYQLAKELNLFEEVK